MTHGTPWSDLMKSGERFELFKQGFDLCGRRPTDRASPMEFDLSCVESRRNVLRAFHRSKLAVLFEIWVQIELHWLWVIFGKSIGCVGVCTFPHSCKHLPDLYWRCWTGGSNPVMFICRQRQRSGLYGGIIWGNLIGPKNNKIFLQTDRTQMLISPQYKQQASEHRQKQRALRSIISHCLINHSWTFKFRPQAKWSIFFGSNRAKCPHTEYVQMVAFCDWSLSAYPVSAPNTRIWPANGHRRWEQSANNCWMELGRRNCVNSNQWKKGRGR